MRKKGNLAHFPIAASPRLQETDKEGMKSFILLSGPRGADMDLKDRLEQVNTTTPYTPEFHSLLFFVTPKSTKFMG